VKDLTLNLQWYLDEAGFYHQTNYTGTPQGYFDTVHTIDFNASYQALASLSVAAEYLYKTAIDNSSDFDRGVGNDKYSPKAQGYALYATYTTPVANLSVAGRFEQWMSPDLGNGTWWGNPSVGANSYVYNSYTLTVKYAAGPLTHILEYRADASNDYNFQTNGNNNNVGASQVDQTVTYAAVYGF